MVLLPESWSLSHRVKSILAGSSLILLFVALYISYSRGCSLANPQTLGGENYAALQFGVLGCIVGIPALAFSSGRPVIISALLMLTLPLTAFFIPVAVLSVVKELAQRICTS